MQGRGLWRAAARVSPWPPTGADEGAWEPLSSHDCGGRERGMDACAPVMPASSFLFTCTWYMLTTSQPAIVVSLLKPGPASPASATGAGPACR